MRVYGAILFLSFYSARMAFNDKGNQSEFAASYFAVFLCGFAALREPSCIKR